MTGCAGIGLRGALFVLAIAVVGLAVIAALVIKNGWRL